MLNQKHSKDDSLTTTIYTVYKAKRDAEVMAGVGKETDLLILTKNGQKKLTSNDLITLNSIYMGELNYGKTHSDLSKLDLKGI